MGEHWPEHQGVLPAVFKRANNFFLNNFKSVYHEQGWSASLKQVSKFPE